MTRIDALPAVAPDNLPDADRPTIIQAPPDGIAPAWFARAGLPLEGAEAAAIIAMLRALDVDASTTPTLEIEQASWHELVRILREEDHDNQWWDAEESERERLWTIGADRMTERALVEVLGEAARAVAIDIFAAASALGVNGAVGPDSNAVAGPHSVVKRAAAEAALLAVHQHSLAALADAGPDHYFVIKYALFAGGRWPLGPRAGKFLIL